MSSRTIEKNVVTISGNPEVYINGTDLVIKDKAYPLAALRGCRVAEVGGFEEGDLFYANETGPGRAATNGMKWFLGLVGRLKLEQPAAAGLAPAAFPEETEQSAPAKDVDPPLFCLSLATANDEIEVLPSINRLLLLDLAARINRELGF